MKNIFLALLLLLSCSVLRAQDIHAFKDSLMLQDSLLGSQAFVVEHDNLDSTLFALSRSLQVNEIDGFRVSIFADNSQSARASAEEIKQRFDDEFPEVCSYLKYRNPDFTVTVGDYSTLDEATILLGRIKGSFNRAFIIRERVRIGSLYKVPFVPTYKFIDGVTLESQVDSL